MSTIFQKTITTARHKNYKINIERFDSAMEVAESCKTRTITSSSFDNMQTYKIHKWHGVKSYDQALELLHDGYEPVVEKLKQGTKINAQGVTKRITFQNEIQGFAPVVPLAIMGVPNSMINTTIKPIKRKVLNVYYDITASAGTDSQDIIDAGAKLAGAILELEQQGYRFNLYAVQSYTGSCDADMLLVKIKSSDKPLDLRRMSFPLCHTAFFRVIGFDWYSKFPKGTYRAGYGHNLSQEFSSDRDEFIKQVLGDDAIFIAAHRIINSDSKDEIKEVLKCNM